MILQALADYYHRKSTQDDSPIAPPGWETKEIPYVVVISSSGSAVQVESTVEGEGRTKRAKVQLIPAAVKRSSGIKANLLWDNVEYALGVPTGKSHAPGNEEKARKKVVARHQAFTERVEELAERACDEGLDALSRFLETYDGSQIGEERDWQEFLEKGPFLSFRLKGDQVLIPQRPKVRAFIDDAPAALANAVCLVSGKPDSVAELHPAIKGVRGAQSVGANIVSFNLDAFRSFSKKQGANAPVGHRTTFAYTTALNHLLGKDSKQKVQVGDATTVFWSEKSSGTAMEHAFAGWFDPPKDDPDDATARVKALYDFKQGKPLTDDDDQRFFVLGLSPNAARVSIRFWHVATIREIGARIFQHFTDLDIVRPPGAAHFPSIYWLLRSIAVLEKAKNVPPNLAGDWMRAILTGTPYPQTLLQSAVRRCRARHDVGPLRAAIVKASLNRSRSESEREISVALDPENTNTGYCLGRLFAIFEKIQEAASPDLKATIRDRYFGSASASPLVAFPILNRLKMHHLSKIESRGRMVYFEKLNGEVMNGLDAKDPFPPHLSLADQGRFAVGYYHQRQKFFEKTGGEK